MLWGGRSSFQQVGSGGYLSVVVRVLLVLREVRGLAPGGTENGQCAQRMGLDANGGAVQRVCVAGGYLGAVVKGASSWAPGVAWWYRPLGAA